ncbi:solute carrier family 12 member 3 isoform X2 [Etheostoma spectabile]|uniref:solute carrier family 12 member 3 isoform X2 n=1 Tax=Etheostoma spectabile TaxID=54343 RepID=UPI0013AFA5BD|nr:solute carrier family 12 member 3-like isoform X2 [Etheostoma spectabile]
MGQFTSKRGGVDPRAVPNVRFSGDEGPPSYSTHGMPPTIVISDVESSASERRGSRVELRRSSVYSTIDQVPQLGHYTRTLHHQKGSRPSLDALRKAFEEKEAAAEVSTTDSGDGSLPNSGPEAPKGPPKKAPARFGWFIGVMMRCMLNIWGVILFLRVTVITSQAGIVVMWVIIGLSVMVTTITGLSISAIATNGRVISGGTYFMISRSLGYELGAPIGLVFSFANALACALNTVGFSIVVRDLMRDYNVIIVDDLNDVRIVGVITLVILLMITLAGMEWESKTQILFFIILLVSFADYLVGTLIPHSKEKQSKGLFGYNKDIFISNLTPDWRGPDGNFFRMFSIFFPGATGILSGVNICGDLKDPATAIPKGTLGAILVTTLSYLILSVTSGASVVRDASGNISDYIGGNITSDCVGLGCNFGWNFTKCILAQNCKFGLANTSKVMGLLSGSYYLIIAGVFAATLSSALGFLVSAPKIFQCLCKDKIYPYIGFFGKGYGKNNEPLRAYVLCFLIAVALVIYGDLNTIAALNSNLFMCSYALINFSCFHASITNAPGWRPMFHYYNKWLALFAAAVAVLLMFLFTWWAALVVLSVMASLFIYVTYNKPNVNWGSSVQAGSYNMALSYSVALTGVNDHVKNYRPQCLVLTGPPTQRPALVDFVDSFTKHASLMICGDIIMDQDRQSQPQEATDKLVKWMNKRKVRSFYSSFPADSLRVGARNLLQTSGLGKLKPNILVLGFKSNWRDSSPESIDDYINTMYDTFDTNYSLCILRMMEGLDVSDQFDFEVNKGFEPDESIEKDNQKSPQKKPGDIPEEDNKEQMKTVFQTDQGKKTIDVYWIADDGGLTLLVPYLLTRRKRWHNCKVRVFVVGDEQNMEENRAEMLKLLDRFRFGFKDVTVMTDSEKRPQAKSLERFEESVAPFRLYDEQYDGVSAQELRENSPWKIPDKEFEAFRQKSETKVRLNEIIRRNSMHAGLVLVSLPVPHSDCTSALYMAWLDTLTCGLHCPVVLIRGNQENVLTFYCQ